MKVKVQVVIEADDATTSVVREVFTLERGDLGPGSVGLALAEAKDLLGAVQEAVVSEQAHQALAGRAACPGCGKARRHKDSRTIVLRTLFGTFRLCSPRWYRCSCEPAAARSFTPLAELLPERTTPELRYLEAKFAGLASYGLSAKLLAEVLPLGRPLHATAVRLHAQAVAERLEGELGEEQWAFVEGCPLDWQDLPGPDLPLTVGLDGGFVHSTAQTSRRDGWFEVIAGKSIPAEGKAKCFAFVQTYDPKPKRRLFELLRSQGMQMNQQVTFLTDGADDVRDLPRFLNPQAEYWLDWFHVTMRLTVMANMAKGLNTRALTPATAWAADLDEDEIAHYRKVTAGLPGELERLKWFLWHGNVFRALQVIGDLEFDLEALGGAGDDYAKLHKAIVEFDTYIRANAASIPNYGELHQAGERISSAIAESTVNVVVSKRMVKKQQMRWSPRGAHLLLQLRTRALNDTLADDFHRWYPDFTHEPEEEELHALAA
jgi:hypothetical protein